MLKKFSSVIVVFALCCSLGVPTAFGGSSSEPETKSKVAETATKPVGPGKSEVAPIEKPNEKLRADMLKLVRDAKAGKVTLPAKSQIQPPTSNNWSKETKVAVGVGVAVAVVVLILVVKHEKDHFLDGLGAF
jgi:hypothetical protein